MLPTTGFVKTKMQASFLLDTCISFFDIPTRCHKWHRGQHSLLKRASAYKPLTDVNIHHVLAIHVRIHFLSCVLFFTFLPWDENRHRALSLNEVRIADFAKTKALLDIFSGSASFFVMSVSCHKWHHAHTLFLFLNVPPASKLEKSKMAEPHFL